MLQDLGTKKNRAEEQWIDLFLSPFRKSGKRSGRRGGGKKRGDEKLSKDFFRSKKRKDGGRKEEEEGPKANFSSSSVLAFSRLLPHFCVCGRQGKAVEGRREENFPVSRNGRRGLR